MMMNTRHSPPSDSADDDEILLASGMRISRSQVANGALFKGVDLDQILPELQQCDIWKVDVNDVVMDANATNNQVFLLLSGVLSVLISEAGSDPITINLHPGQSVGEISVIDGLPSSAQVIAYEASVLLVIDARIFWAIVEKSTRFAHNIMALLAYRIRYGNVTIADSMRLQKQYEHHATVDSLTGLRNRRWFDDTLTKILTRDAYNHQPTCLIILDIDDFKRVNDHHGHQAGDGVLWSIASIINSSIRPDDMSARYGGEEFVVILPDTHTDEAVLIAERLRMAVASHDFKIENYPEPVKLTISLGVATATQDESARSLIFRTDNALYMAKEKGKNQTYAISD